MEVIDDKIVILRFFLVGNVFRGEFKDDNKILLLFLLKVNEKFKVFFIGYFFFWW